MGVLPLPCRSDRDHSVVADAETSPLLADPLGLVPASNHKSIGSTDSWFIRAFLGPERSSSCLRRQRHPVAAPWGRLKRIELAWRRLTDLWARSNRQEPTTRTSTLRFPCPKTDFPDRPTFQSPRKDLFRCPLSGMRLRSFNDRERDALLTLPPIVVNGSFSPFRSPKGTNRSVQQPSYLSASERTAAYGIGHGCLRMTNVRAQSEMRSLWAPMIKAPRSEAPRSARSTLRVRPGRAPRPAPPAIRVLPS